MKQLIVFKFELKFKFNFKLLIIMIKFNHPYHLVTMRPWPLIISLRLIIIIRRILIIFHNSDLNIIFISLILLLINLYQ